MHRHEHPHDGPHHHGGVGHRLGATLGVTGAIMIAEVVGGYASGSLALLADAGHMLTDFLALLVAFTAARLSRRPSDQRRTYGYRRLEILAALLNGVALVLVSGSIAYEAIERWVNPTPVSLPIMAGVATLGLGANLLGLYLLRGERHDLNVRGAFLHIVGDTLSSAAVVVAAGVMALTGWTGIDAALSIAIALLIVVTSFSLLREVVEVLLEAAPQGIDTERVRATIGAVQGVVEVHDLHVWSIASGLPALSAHVVVSDPAHDPHDVRVHIQTRLRDEYAIDHSTLQIERRVDAPCGCR